jgi:DNA modification methylase
MPYAIIPGDCRQSFRMLGDNEIGAIVTDPPYEVGISGWDSSGIAYSHDVWREHLRVLRPGGHLIVFGATRTFHRVACAIEDAGLEVRGSGNWLYSSGMPKGRNISKAIDGLFGATRPVIERRTLTAGGGESFGFQKGAKRQVNADITGPATAQAASWEGWNTTLRPAHEPFIIARKPLHQTTNGTLTVERNVLQWGTGAINVRAGEYRSPQSPGMLWPTDVIVSHAPGCTQWKCVEGCGGAALGRNVDRYMQLPYEECPVLDIYCDKPRREEKDIGCWHLPRKAPDPASTMAASSQARERNAAIERGEVEGMLNHHSTVKPVALMSYLIGIFGVPGLPVLDAFCGSGTTGVAAIGRGLEFIGMELTSEYLPVIHARCSYAEAQYQAQAQQRGVYGRGA